MFSKFSVRSASLPFSIGLFLFSIYLLSFSGKFHVMDELAVFTAAHNLSQHGRADINQLIWTNHWTPNPPGIWGNDGNLYTKKPPGISFITAPLIGLGSSIHGLNAVHVGLLTNVFVTALTAALLFIWLENLGFSRPVATLTSLAYGLCTFAWVYARMYWESSLLATAFLVAVWSIYRFFYQTQPRHRWPWLLLCAIAVAIGLALRFEAALVIVFIGLYLVANQYIGTAATGRTRTLGNQEAVSSVFDAPRSTVDVLSLSRSIAVYLAPSLIVGLGLLYFNFIRYGNLGETGYTQEILFRKPWVGGFGLLFSPGSGLFIYAPLMVLLFFGLRPAWRRLPRPYFWLITTICVCYWLFYGSWFSWGGIWTWGPRFLLSILPLLMLFVAEPLEWLRRREDSRLKSGLLWTAVGILATISLIINLLGITVDFNEHFKRLSSSDNYLFNWAVFPPLAHWGILQEGLVDLIWLQPHVDGLKIKWSALLPALVLFVLATGQLISIYRGQKGVTLEKSRPVLKIAQQTPRLAFYVLVSTVVISLTFLTMTGTAPIPLTHEQAKSDLAVLDALAASAQPGSTLLVSMPPFGDLQEFSTLLMAYLEQPLPTYIWIEDGPRAIQANERARVWQAVQAESKRVWLFERWLTQSDPITASGAQLNQTAFPIWERWFAGSGRLTLYALADYSQPSPPIVPMNVTFQGGLTLVDFAVANRELTVKPGDIVKLRLTWQVTAGSEPPLQVIPVGGITVSAQLLYRSTPTRNIAQNDRLLVDLQNFERSPLRPGQTVQQGYGLQVPGDISPGSYPLIVSLYHTATGQRLFRADDSHDDFVYLTDIVVK
jgi:hypothetical protein